MTSSSDSRYGGYRQEERFRHLYGPVPSRRLGRSLGVDVVPYKVCSFDCIYCTLGRTTRAVTECEPLVSGNEVLREIDLWLAHGGTADYITFAGSGEPTLNCHLGDMIRATKRLTSIPLAVITNGSLLGKPEIQNAISDADVLLPSLDAGTEPTFQRVNRPAPGVSFWEMIEGLMKTSREFHGPIWLEIMLVAGVNDSDEELLAMREIIRRVWPDKLQINTVERPSRSGDARRVSTEGLVRACEILGGDAEIIAPGATPPAGARRWERIEDELVGLLARRPCTTDHLVAVSGRNFHEVTKHLQRLMDKGVLEQVGDADPYYRISKGVKNAGC